MDCNFPFNPSSILVITYWQQLVKIKLKTMLTLLTELGEKDIVPAEFARSIRGMVGLRNILVHEYARLDMQKVYYILQNRLNDFHLFINYLNHYLKIEN